MSSHKNPLRRGGEPEIRKLTATRNAILMHGNCQCLALAYLVSDSLLSGFRMTHTRTGLSSPLPLPSDYFQTPASTPIHLKAGTLSLTLSLEPGGNIYTARASRSLPPHMHSLQVQRRRRRQDDFFPVHINKLLSSRGRPKSGVDEKHHSLSRFLSLSLSLAVQSSYKLSYAFSLSLFCCKVRVCERAAMSDIYHE